ncbi:MAG: HAD family hydrolase [Rhodospirillales bacterium]|nr:HAD family hydrolase [Rhodospirillales bacterium]
MSGVRQHFKTIAFDFDGVILESVAIKKDAMAALFADHPQHLDAIISIFERYGGISRYIKFDMIFRDILKTPLGPADRDAMGQKYSALVVDKVLACPFVPGAREFLEAHYQSTPLFVISGTPDAELKQIVSERGLAPYFQGVFGSSRSKPDIIRSLLADQSHGAEEMVFIGDAMTDFEAARETGVPFVGRTVENLLSPFPKSTIIVKDLRGLENALQTLRP